MKPEYLAMRLEVVGKEWTVYYCSKKYFAKRHREHFEEPPGPAAEGTLAFNCQDDKEIFFLAARMRPETILHELTHAYLWELCLWDLMSKAAIGDAQYHPGAYVELMEEAYCDMMAKYGKIMLRQSEQIILAYSLLRHKANANDSKDS